MKKNLTFIFSLIILLNCEKIYSQETDTLNFFDSLTLNNKTIIAKYSGGRFGFSGTYLTLYSDSTYVQSGWLDNGYSYMQNGTFSRNDTLITLCLKIDSTDSKSKSKRELKKIESAACNTYRMRKEMILLYTKKQEKSKDADYFKTYMTLYIVLDTY